MNDKWPTIHDLEKDVHDLCEKARQLEKHYRENLFCKLPWAEMGFVQGNGNKLTDDEAKALINLNRLNAIILIDEYDNITLQQNRGITVSRALGFTGPVDIEPSEQKSACIKLFSGTEQYQEKFEKLERLTLT